jgi:hypothetical protein
MRPIRVDVASSDDLVALYATYLELSASGREATLDVVVAPGEYGVASIGPIRLDLGGDLRSTDPRVDVVVRGAVSEPAAVFRDLGILAAARSLRLERLILTGRHQTVLAARVTRALAIAGCVIVGNEWGGPWGGALVRVTGIYGRPAYTVDIADTWLVANDARSEAALISIAPATGSYVESVALRRVALLENRTRGDVVVRQARRIHAEDVIAVKAGAAGAAILRLAQADQVRIERSALVVDSLAAISAEDTRARSSGIELRDTRIYTASAERGLPPGARGSAVVLDGGPVVARQAAARATLAGLTRRIPDPATAWPHLRDALGLY